MKAERAQATKVNESTRERFDAIVAQTQRNQRG